MYIIKFKHSEHKEVESELGDAVEWANQFVLTWLLRRRRTKVVYLDSSAHDHVGGVLNALVSETDERRVALVSHLLQLRVDVLQTKTNKRNLQKH